eukprot:Skav212194  [mRNA]  locus=scaffold754:597444:598430:- [translate_table: standard]
MPRKLIFSDIDGTLVHISDDALLRWGSLSEDGRSFKTTEGSNIAIRPLPPSSTGTQAFISEKTLKLVAEIRRAGHLFVLISGARSSTFMERLPYLPAADAYVMENGGRIFLPSRDSAETAAPIIEDLEWRRRHVAAPLVLESVPPSDRPGILWDFYARLQKEGWVCDANKYSTDFRVSLKKSKGKTAADLEKVVSSLPSQLASSFNLGMADIYPSSSGKDKAAEYLMAKFGFAREDSISMGDDDNDLALAKIVSHTYIPGFAADSVRLAVEANPLAFTVASHGAFLGTHEVLQKIQELPIRSARPLLICSLAMLSLVVLAARRRQRRA